MREIKIMEMNEQGVLFSVFPNINLEADAEQIKSELKLAHHKLDEKIKQKAEEHPKKEIQIGDVTVELKGQPFAIGVDTFSREDWLYQYFESDQEAIKFAEDKGGEMLKVHAYDKTGEHIGEGGTI